MKCKIDHKSEQVLIYENDTLKYKFQRSELKLLLQAYLKADNHEMQNWNRYDVLKLYNQILEDNIKIKKSEARKIVSELLNLSDKAVQKHIYKKKD